MFEGTRRTLDPPGTLGPRGETLDARVRRKLERGDRLTGEERAFLADLPGSREIPPDVLRASARRHGGEKPIDAATGEPHDAERASAGQAGARDPRRPA